MHGTTARVQRQASAARGQSPGRHADGKRETEREFGIKIPDDDFYKLNTYSVGEFCDVIENVLRK